MHLRVQLEHQVDNASYIHIEKKLSQHFKFSTALNMNMEIERSSSMFDWTLLLLHPQFLNKTAYPWMMCHLQQSNVIQPNLQVVTRELSLKTSIYVKYVLD